jgi:hypothetical protein
MKSLEELNIVGPLLDFARAVIVQSFRLTRAPLCDMMRKWFVTGFNSSSVVLPPIYHPG